MANYRVIRQFAGANIETAVVPKAVQDMMVRYDEKVAHYEVAVTTKPD